MKKTTKKAKKPSNSGQKAVKKTEKTPKSAPKSPQKSSQKTGQKAGQKDVGITISPVTKRKNRIILFLLMAWIVILFLVTLVKMSGNG